MKRSLPLGLLACLLTAPAWAQEGDGVDACMSAFDSAQRLRADAKLLETKEKLVACAQAECPDPVENKCNEWLTELESTIPSIVVVVPVGVAAGEVKVWIDDVEQPEALAGRAIELDPGSHTIRYQRGDEAPVEQPVVVAEGEQKKRIELTVDGDEPPVPGSGPTPEATPAEEAGISPLVWIGFGVAGAGAIAGAVTGGLTLSNAGDLDGQCVDKQCPESARDTYDTAQTLSTVSTVSFAVAGAGAIVGIVGIVLSLDGDGADAPDSARVTPLIGPGYLGLRGRF